MSIFNLPDLGEGLPDAEIVEWHVKVGDQVEVDQPMVSMETAKAVVDVPVPTAGTVVKLYGEPGDVIETGSPLIEFSESGTTAPESKQTAEPEQSASQLREQAEQVLQDLGGEVDQHLPQQDPQEAIGTVVGQMESSDKVIDNMQSIGDKKAAPAVRALAKKLKVDLSTVQATGKGGVIRPSDVKAAAAATAQPAQQAPQATAQKVAAPQPQPPTSTATVTPPAPPISTGGNDWQQVKGSRRTMARVMQIAHQNIVPTTIMDDADIHQWQVGQDITGRLIRSLVVAAKAEPALNAWFDGEKLARRLIDHVDIGIAVDTEDGLFVPTMRNCESLDAAQVRQQMNLIKQQVTSRSIPPEAMKDYTIMLSNFGIYAGKYATPVITPPCVAIIAAGKLHHQAIPVIGGIEAHRVIPLSLTFDHRAVTGGEAARFLAAMIADLNQPC